MSVVAWLGVYQLDRCTSYRLCRILRVCESERGSGGYMYEGCGVLNVLRRHDLSVLDAMSFGISQTAMTNEIRRGYMVGAPYANTLTRGVGG